MSARLIAMVALVLAGCSAVLGIDDRDLSTCDNGARDGFETDVDCGGPDCRACAIGGACVEGSDCSTGICVDDACVCPTEPCELTATPVAACDVGFMYQGRQDAFAPVLEGLTCSGIVAFSAVGRPMLESTTICWARADGALVCDGELGGTVYTPDTPTGVSGVVQILGLSDGLCAVSADGTAWCTGTQGFGQFGLGDADPVGLFERWGAGSVESITAMGVRGGAVICALTAAGELHCAGHQMGNLADPSATPVLIASDVEAFYLDGQQIQFRTGAGAFAYDPLIDGTVGSLFDVCRVGHGDRMVKAPGIVDALGIGPEPEGVGCTLRDSGRPACTGLSFSADNVLAIAGNSDELMPQVFAVRSDGAIIDGVDVVFPPGTVRVPACE